MEQNQDIRWKQRFSNYKKALSQLERFVNKKDLSEMEQQGLIQSFEYVFELGWNVLKDFLENNGQENIYGSRDTIRLAFKLGLIENGDGWMNMLKSRVKTTHTYNEDTANEVSQEIVTGYFELFKEMEIKFNNLL
ncbi:MAG: nucleotidyltransferase [Bacteroidetes bacterium GWC2_33_15]|nr:MAG: nucleotidyltransferase [Bacteroidetes bacterium GWA2_33_15]OFX51974.1 MAG: nucleotidyltransferase [Bacteroidetes bacterium GWC2_33_15]OFX63804.1 MAG: nucleotidyltransferase [Bacteroidetes bacterium GWB2_32_14]OFX67377.1 MAG: nucleotidyltransferase [Bacteroidetes bacterium GWD2_33_33]HAN17861.1 nucleotidyltransferase [Bacteroidales bacterium]